jgi:ABC-2 type transport system permease protein
MLKKYLALFRASWQGIIEYRASMFIWMLLGTAPLISLAVWLSVAENGPVGNYTSTAFIAYYLASIFVRELTGSWVVWELEYQIRQGTLSAKLLKPLNPIHDAIAVHIADKIFRLPLILPPLALVAWFVGIQYALSWLNAFYVLLAMALAFGIIFLSAYCIGLLNFWLTHAMAISELWFALRNLLGGILAPIDLFPEPIPTLSPYLPFRYTLSFPVEIIIGRLSTEQILFGFAMQSLWLLVFLALYGVLWRQGLKTYSAVGA